MTSSSEKVRVTSPCVIVHGGAWKIPEDLEEGSGIGCRNAAIKAYRLLKSGSSCVDAVEAAVMALEDDERFDAGRGSVLNEVGEIEMHAMMMQGEDCDVGGCIGMKEVKNPIKVARIILEKSQHCILNSDAALKLARCHGIEEAKRDYFLTQFARDEFNSMNNYTNSINDLFNSKVAGHDTVGAVALDARGNFACATSTGGITRQIAGRVSDSCLPGCGGFADNEIGAISTTGHGESIMKVSLARSIANNLQRDLPPFQAIQEALENMKRRVGGCGGAICIDRHGRADICFNTDKMSWAKVADDQFVTYGVDLTKIHKSKICSADVTTHDVTTL